MSTSPTTSKLYLISAMLWLSTIVLWTVLWFFNPYAQSEAITIPGVIMLFAAVAGLVSSYSQKPKLLLALALVSFIPIGLYLLGTPGIFLIIGVLNIVCIALATRLLFVGT
jgi:hypothetical protein